MPFMTSNFVFPKRIPILVSNTKKKMERKTVVIPNIAEEVRIGYSFNHLIKVIAETDATRTVQWDYKNVHFVFSQYMELAWYYYFT